ncbi:MAG: hypothetical protein JWQ97_2131, partial [Phenylobacterium sp.]|nr:hypothetical protein [Phenylobacterium sp.]
LGASFLALAREAPQLVPLRQPGLERFQVSARPQEIAAAEQVLAQMKRDPGLRSGARRQALERRIGEGAEGEIIFLLEIADAAAAVAPWRAAQTGPAPSLATLDFVDPFGDLFGAAPVRGLDIVYDPERTLPSAVAAPLNAAWRRADALLVRRCLGGEAVVALAGPALRGRRRIPVDPCWDLYVAGRP